jgi:CDP-diacylglycerol--glycerol-3-phosphate 3-phosphatidyltransferase
VAVNIPNTLTWMRIVLIPVLVLVYYIPFAHHHLIGAAIFAVAGITDWFDGYLARKLDQMTSFGAFLDPVADKLMVSIALVLLVEQHDQWGFTLAAMVIVGREIVISALREWMAELGQRTSVAVSYIGKVKTVVQMVAITGLLAFPPRSEYEVMMWISYALLYIAATLTLWSMYAYMQAASRVLSETGAE